MKDEDEGILELIAYLFLGIGLFIFLVYVLAEAINFIGYIDCKSKGYNSTYCNKYFDY